ncbi:MAG: glycosyltransferase family 2 protein [Bdellovibrionaceae bacterium]|nr:glycosyltransferase family 2 protein [Pseudobdellovibrionaceae bacterium]
MKLPISLVVISKNEELNIERCLKSAENLVSEMLVLDSGSSDKTVEIAQKAGARVLETSWEGFGAQKARGAREAQHDWILSLDSDEALSPELAAEIHAKFSSLDPKAGYEMPRKSFHMGRWILHGGWYPDRQLRLFNRAHSMWNQAPIHEKVECARRERLNHPLLHWVFRNLHHQIDTNNRYSSLQAAQAVHGGREASLLMLIFKPWSKFIECYVWKRGFLDGIPGFIIAVGAAYSVFLKWAKIWETKKCQNNPS